MAVVRPEMDTRPVASPGARVPLFCWKEFACGWGAAFVNIAVTYPIYKMIFRQMLHGVQLHQAFGQIRGEGITFLYRGIFPPLAQKTISLSVMFGVYDGTRRPLVEWCGMNEYVAKSIAGVTAGTVEAVLMPFERVQTLLADATYHAKYRNTHHAFRMDPTQWIFPILLLSCAVGSASASNSETALYVVSVIKHLEATVPGVSSCVLYRMFAADDVLQEVLRAPQLGSVSKIVITHRIGSTGLELLPVEHLLVVNFLGYPDAAENHLLGSIMVNSTETILNMDKIHAHIVEREVAELVLPKYYDPVQRLYRYSILDQSLGTIPRLYILSLRNPFKPVLEYTNAALLESGLISVYWPMMIKLKAGDRVIRAAEEADETLLFADMKPAWMALAVGLALSGVVFAGEICVKMVKMFAVILIYIEHGFRELYRGLVPILWRNGPSNAMFFVMREEADRRLPKRATAVTQRTQEFFAGACIGAFISSVFYPINVLKVTMQSKLGGPNESMWVALQQVYNERDRKLRNVYKGVSMNCTRAFFSWGIMNSAYEQLKKVFY
ncbi:hypothetical protein quinque_000565 [Culex quinquefasciatus]